MNLEVLKSVYGNKNVSGDLETGITIKANREEQEEHSWVVDMNLKGAVKRIVIPKGKVVEVDEIAYNSKAVGYGTKISAYPDTSGQTHYEYIKATPAAENNTDNAEDNTGNAEDNTGNAEDNTGNEEGDAAE